MHPVYVLLCVLGFHDLLIHSKKRKVMIVGISDTTDKQFIVNMHTISIVTADEEAPENSST